MKINTNTMTPLAKVAPDTKKTQGNCLYNTNKYIPDGALALESHEKQEQGSWIRYIPTPFFTPVKTSARLADRPGTLDSAGVDALNEAFSNLVIGEPKETKGETIHPTDTDDSISSHEEEEIFYNGPKLGRYKTTAMTHESTKVGVIRCYRFASDDE